MTTTFSCPYRSKPVFIISMKNDGRQIERFFANSSRWFEPGSILPCLTQMVSQFEPGTRQTRSVEESADTHAAILALEAFLGRNLNGNDRLVALPFNYDDIRQFSMLSDFSISDATIPLFVNWLVECQIPVIHLVRKNPLDCFVEDLLCGEPAVGADAIRLDVSFAVETIRQMQKDVEEFRNLLVPSNRIEIYTESLFDSDGYASELVLHQLAIHLGLQDKSLSFEGSIRPTETSTLPLQIKAQLRPALIRAGYENLYQLPRAA